MVELMVQTQRETALTKVHRQVATALNSLAAAQGPVVKLSAIAQKTGSDPRTVQRHLKLLEVSHMVIFVNHDKTLVAPAKALGKLVEKVQQDVEREEMLAMSWESSGAILERGVHAKAG